jgi:hypothetical protein
MQNFGEENCQTVPSSKMESDLEVLPRMEVVQVRVQYWGFGVNGVGYSGHFIRSSVNHLVFQSGSQ